MKMEDKSKKKKIIISLGGSLISKEDEEINKDYIIKFKEFISSFSDIKFIVVVGGGKISRKYIDSAKELGVNKEGQDWIGIMATRINAEFVKAVFSNLAYEKVIYDPHEKIRVDKKVIIYAGYKPGWSTDYDAVLLAETYGAKKILNMSNIKYIYDKNPKENSDAKAIKEMSWKEFKRQFGEEWNPGMNSPFDPIAGKKASEIGIEVAVVDGEDLSNVKNYLADSPFEGTIIK